MSWLPSRLPFAPVALAPPFSSWAITRRRFAAVMAVLGKLPLHLAQARQDVLHLLAQAGILGSLRCQLGLNSGHLGSFCGQFHFQLCDVFFCCHGPIVTASAIPDLSSYLISHEEFYRFHQYTLRIYTPSLQRASSTSHIFRPSRILQQEKGYQSHHERQSNTDSERDLWRDPKANERLRQR